VAPSIGVNAGSKVDGGGDWNRDSDSQAAYAAAAWLQGADLNGSLPQSLNPPLEPEEPKVAAIDGWILGVV
jgi:hypothetical protein